MADTVTSKTIFNGSKKLIMQFTSRSDGTGESNVVKVDKSTLLGPDGTEPSSLVIEKIEGDVVGMEVLISVDLGTDENLVRIGGFGRFCLNYRKVGGLQTSGAGGTGDILFSTNGQSAGDTYNIVLHMRKKD